MSNLLNFKGLPSVVEADKENEITIKSIDGKIKYF